MQVGWICVKQGFAKAAPFLYALQIAVAVMSRCGAFLTNDRVLARDVGIEVILLDDYVTQ